MSADHPNPYVGPRAYQIDETLYGRTRELRQLTDRLLAERIVLLHSPSGAGKSSLVQAGLIPYLREEGFHVHSVIRVNLERPANLQVLVSASGEPVHHSGEEIKKIIGKDNALLGKEEFNRYIFSTLLSLEEGCMLDSRLDLELLSHLDLDDYLTYQTRASNRKGPEFLIFDQFEEFLTIDPVEREAKNRFFTLLGQALKNRDRWALFVMREDYLGALEPYVRSVPTYFSNTFRLDFLGVDAALDAIQKPAADVGMNFAGSAATRLVDDLRRVQVQQPDGKVESVLGPYVEPVQLQVVCYRLWETLNFDDQEINEKDLALVGDVDESLADYYSLSVSRAAQETGVRERTIRDWFETSLITPEGIRAQVLMGAETSEGLDNRAVRYLENAHIIRGEKRAGAAWFELAHDRLIEPVRRSNAGWFGKNLNLFQLQALTWNQQGRSEGLLLRGKELDDARNNMAADQLLTPIETTFLDACLALRRHEQRDSRLRQYIIAGLVASLVFLVMAVIGLYAANNARADAVLSAQAAQTSQADALTQKSEAEKQKTEAEKQARLSLIRQLGSQAVVQAQTDPDLAMLLASEAVNLQGKLGGPIPLEINKDLVTVLTSGPRPLKYLRGHTGSVLSVAVSPDSAWAASAGDDGIIRIWNLPAGDLLFSLAGHNGKINSLAFDPISQPPELYSAGEDGSLRTWKWLDSTHPPQSSVFTHLHGPARALAFDQQGKMLAAGGDDQTVTVFDPKSGAIKFSFTGHTAPIHSLVFNSDGNLLASVDTANGLGFWDINKGEALNPATPVLKIDSHMEAMTFIPGSQLGIVGYGTTTSWFTIGAETGLSQDTYWYQQVIQHTSSVRALTFSPDGSILASASEDWRIGYCPKFSTYPDPSCFSTVFLNAHDGPVNTIAFSPDNHWLISGGDDGNVLIWNAYYPYLSRSFFAAPLQGRRWNVEGLAFGPDNKTLASSNWDGSIRIWDIETGKIIHEFYPYQGTQGVIALSPDGAHLAFSAESGPQRIWNLDGSVFRELPVQPYLSALAFSPDGKWLATDNNSAHSICLWSMEGKDDFCQSVPGDEAIGAFAFSPTSQFLATSQGKKVLLWDVTTFPLKSRLLGSHDGGIFSMAFSPDGKWLASGAGDYTIRLWGLQPSLPTSIILRYNGRFSRRVAFSPDSRLLVSANEDWTLRWWDVDTAKPLVEPLKIRSDRLDSVAFSPNGKWLAVGSFDGLIDLFPGELDYWKDAACSIANRNLTHDEWDLYLGGSIPFEPVCPGLPVEPAGLSTPAP